MNWTGGSRKRTVGSKFRSSKKYRQQQFFRQRREQKQRSHPGGLSRRAGPFAAEKQTARGLAAATTLPTSTAHCLSADLVKLGIAGFHNQQTGRAKSAQEQNEVHTTGHPLSGGRQKKPKISPELRQTACRGPDVAASSIVTITEQFANHHSPDEREDVDTQSSPPLFLLATNASSQHQKVSSQEAHDAPGLGHIGRIQGEQDFDMHSERDHQENNGPRQDIRPALSYSIRGPSRRQGTSSSSDSTMAMVSLSNKGRIRFIDNEVDRTTEVEKGMWDFSQVANSPNTVVNGNEDRSEPEQDDAQTLTKEEPLTGETTRTDHVQNDNETRALALKVESSHPASPEPQRLTDFEQKMLGIIELSFMGDDGSIAFMDLLLKRRACIKELPLLLQQGKLTEGFLGILQETFQIGYNSIDAETLRSARLIEKLIKQGHHKYRPRSNAVAKAHSVEECSRTHSTVSSCTVEPSQQTGSDSWADLHEETQRRTESQSAWPGIESRRSPRWSDASSSDDESSDEAILNDPLADPLATTFRPDHGLWTDSVMSSVHPTGLLTREALILRGNDETNATSPQTQREDNAEPEQHHIQLASDNNLGYEDNRARVEGESFHVDAIEDDADADDDDESFDDDCMSRLHRELAEPSHVPQRSSDLHDSAPLVLNSDLQTNSDITTSANGAPGLKQENASAPASSHVEEACSDSVSKVHINTTKTGSNVCGDAKRLPRMEARTSTNAGTRAPIEAAAPSIATKENLSESEARFAHDAESEVKSAHDESTACVTALDIADGAQRDDEG